MCLKHILSEALCLCECDLLLRQYTVELSDCILTRIDLCRIDPRSVKDWPDVTGRSVTDWLEVWRIDQKLQTWHGKHRPEVIDQKCEGLTRSVKDWPEVYVWNMIDQKCEGLTRIDQKYVFETCLHSLYPAWDVFVVWDGALLCVFFLHMPQKLPWPSGLGAPEGYATFRV